MEDIYRLLSLVRISIIVLLVILFYFTKIEFVVFSVILGVVFISSTYAMENHFEYFQELGYNLNQKEISLPNLMYKMHTTGQVPTDRQLNAVKRIYQKALNDAFIFKK